MGLGHCWHDMPRGRGLSSLKHLFFGVQICPQQLMQEASWRLQRWERGQCPNVMRQPCCHPQAPQRAPCAHSPAGATVSSPYVAPLSLAHSGASHHWVTGKSSASPPLTQVFASTLGQQLCQGSLQWDPSKPSAVQARLPWKADGGPANPIPSPQHHLLLTPALYRHHLAESSPRHAQAGPQGPESPGVPWSRACLASSAGAPYLQAQKSGSELGAPAAFEPSLASAPTETFRKSRLISTAPNSSLVKQPQTGTSTAAPAGMANPALPDWDQSPFTGKGRH